VHKTKMAHFATALKVNKQHVAPVSPAAIAASGAHNMPLPASALAPLTPSRSQSASSPSRRATTPQRRDSQRVRLSRGQPGSRRYQRWLNNQFPIMEAEDHGHDRRNITNLEIESTSFADVFETEEDSAAWDPFIDVTIEQETDMIGALQEAVRATHAQRTKSTENPLTGQKCFHRIDSRIRQCLRRYNGGLLEEYESELLRFVQEGKPSSEFTVPHKLNEHALVCLFDQGFERLICHAICQYHALPCHSHDTPQGSRATMILRPKLRHCHPERSLTAHLQSRHAVRC